MYSSGWKGARKGDTYTITPPSFSSSPKASTCRKSVEGGYRGGYIPAKTEQLGKQANDLLLLDVCYVERWSVGTLYREEAGYRQVSCSSKWVEMAFDCPGLRLKHSPAGLTPVLVFLSLSAMNSLASTVVELASRKKIRWVNRFV